MAAHSIKTVQKIPVSLDIAWDFFSNPANLQAITPDKIVFQVISKHHGNKMYPGQIIEYTVKPLFNIPLYLPITAFFVPATFAFGLAIFPTFWAYQGFDVLIGGGNFWLYMLIGFAHSILLLVWMVKKFTVSHFK